MPVPLVYITRSHAHYEITWEYGRNAFRPTISVSISEMWRVVGHPNQRILPRSQDG
jgi:hypothetical protein